MELANRLVSEGRQADLIIGNNVLAQVPDLNDFTAGDAQLLAPNGVITLEFPHLERLIAKISSTRSIMNISPTFRLLRSIGLPKVTGSRCLM